MRPLFRWYFPSPLLQRGVVISGDHDAPTFVVAAEELCSTSHRVKCTTCAARRGARILCAARWFLAEQNARRRIRRSSIRHSLFAALGCGRRPHWSDHAMRRLKLMRHESDRDQGIGAFVLNQPPRLHEAQQKRPTTPIGAAGPLRFTDSITFGHTNYACP